MKIAVLEGSPNKHGSSKSMTKNSDHMMLAYALGKNLK